MKTDQGHDSVQTTNVSTKVIVIVNMQAQLERLSPNSAKSIDMKTVVLEEATLDIQCEESWWHSCELNLIPTSLLVVFSSLYSNHKDPQTAKSIPASP